MRVVAIHRYPVKSMLGESLPAAEIGERGLSGDRGYAVLDTADGSVASAKSPRKWAPLLQCSARYLAEPTPGETPPVEITLADGRRLRSDDADVDDVLSRALDRPVRLVREAADARVEEVWPAVEGLAPRDFIDATRSGTDPDGRPVSTIPLGALAPPGTFFDVATLHVLSTATLRTLADHAPDADFDAGRYRPNLLVEADSDGYAEDAWVGRTLRVGSAMTMHVAMATMRCVMTTLAQRDLADDPQTLRTIARRHRLDIPGLGTWACAGVYATVTAAGTVRLGDPLA